MKLALDGLNPQDTFNLITFSGDTRILFPEPVPATRDNLARAQEFLAGTHGSGGTEMMKAIRAALDPSDAQDHIRVVCFMTDGYVGNDMEVVAEVQKHPNARVFSFGIGNSVNRFLLDRMAQYGRGEVEYVGLKDDGSAAARRFQERVRNPLLTDIGIDWGGLAVTDVYPKRVPDLFGAKPVIIHGRYTAPGAGVVRLRGRMAGREFTRELRVTLPSTEPQHDVLASLWARTRIDDLMGQDYSGMQTGQTRTDIRDAITQLGLDYRLMTQFTSFVAVEEMTITDGGQPRRVEVPVEMPEGVSYEGVFGKEKNEIVPASTFAAVKTARLLSPGVVGGVGRQDVAVSRPPSKMHPAIEALIRRPGATGKAEIQVWLTDTSPARLEKLKQLGFEIVLQPKTAKMLIGRLPVANLEALLKLAFVRYIAPQNQGQYTQIPNSSPR
jgi:Ca-activated chloride channel family protein